MWSLSSSLLQCATFALVATASTASAQTLQPAEDCPILGPAFPSSFDIANTAAFQNAVESFPSRLEELFEDGTFDRTSTAISVDVFSAHSNQSIFSHYYVPPSLNESLTQGVLNDGTIQRIGSVSKLFTIYALIVKGGWKIFQDPVTKYVPELAGNPEGETLDKIRFEDVTVEALASHIAGTGGFSIEHSTCLNNTSPPSCTVGGYLSDVREMPPVAPIFGTALYSDQAYGILTRVLERLTGLTYDEAIRSILAEPLGLNGTSAVIPEEAEVNGFARPGVPGIDTAWGFDNVLIAGSGGVYSSFADLRKLGLSILNAELLSKNSIRSWMKPRSFVAPLTVALGAPWEINRLPLTLSPGSNRTRVIDLYTKGGGQPNVGTIFALSPDHGIGFSVIANSLDPEPALEERWPLRQLVGDIFVTAAEHAAHENALNNIAGTYVDAVDESTNITLTVDAERPGVGISSMFVNGTEVRSGISGGSAASVPQEKLSVRMYPSGLEEKNGNVRELAFRAIPLTLPPARTRAAAEGGTSLFENRCLNFLSVGFSKGADGVHGSDEFVLRFASGRLESVAYRSAGVMMVRPQ